MSVGKAFGISFVLGAALSPSVTASFRTVKETAQALQTDLKSMRAVSSKARAVADSGRELAALRAARAVAGDSDRAMLDSKIKTVSARFERAAEAARKHGLSVAQCASEYKRLDAKIVAAESSLARLNKRQANKAKREELHGEMIGTVATVMAVAAPVTLAMDFESAFADAKKVMDDFTEEEVAQMPRDIRRLSSETGLAAADIAGIYAAAASAKIARSRAELRSFAATAARMAVAFGMSADEAGQRMASWRSKMGLTQEQVETLADSINHLGNNMAADPLKTSEVVERVGAVAKTAGLATNQIAALGATFVAASPSPEIAATGMKNFLLALSKGTAMSKDQQEAFGRLGFDPKLLAKDMQQDAEGTILRVLSALKRMPAAEQGSLLSEMFGTESLGAIAPMLQNLDELRKAFDNVRTAQSYAGSMSKEYESRSATSKNALARLRRTVESLAIGVGSVLLPHIVTLANGLSAVVLPLTSMAEEFPVLTSVVMGAASGLAALKVAAVACAYAGTLISDGWLIARGIVASLRPTVLAHRAALIAYRTVALASAVATKVAAAAQWALNAAMTANPIGKVVAGAVALGAAIWALYTYCEPVRRVVDGLWQGVASGARAAWGAVTGVWSSVVQWFESVSLFDVGSRLLTTLVDGIKAVAMAPVEAVASVVAKIREFLPGSDAERGPLSTLTASGAAIPATLARGMDASRDGGLGRALDRSLDAGLPGEGRTSLGGRGRALDRGLDTGLPGAGKASGGNSGGGIVIHFAPTIHASGPAAEAAVEQQLRMSESRLREMLKNILNDERRLSYA